MLSYSCSLFATPVVVGWTCANLCLLGSLGIMERMCPFQLSSVESVVESLPVPALCNGNDISPILAKFDESYGRLCC